MTINWQHKLCCFERLSTSPCINDLVDSLNIGPQRSRPIATRGYALFFLINKAIACSILVREREVLNPVVSAISPNGLAISCPGANNLQEDFHRVVNGLCHVLK